MRSGSCPRRSLLDERAAEVILLGLPERHLRQALSDLLPDRNPEASSAAAAFDASIAVVGQGSMPAKRRVAGTAFQGPAAKRLA